MTPFGNSTRGHRHVSKRLSLKNSNGTSLLTPMTSCSDANSSLVTLERGERRLDVVQFLDFAEALGFEPSVAIRKISAVKR
jgi:hypothetical protein